MTASATNTRKGLKKYFRSLPGNLRPHFEYFLKILDFKLPLEIAVAYVFYRIELAHRDTLHFGIIKKYRAEAGLVGEIIQKEYIERANFPRLLKNVLGIELPAAIKTKLEMAEGIRDKAMHGRRPTNAELRNAIKLALEYSHDYNKYVKRKAHFAPFGNLRGQAGGSDERLDRDTTRVVLKGLGFLRDKEKERPS
jgi:hypothetical protein